MTQTEDGPRARKRPCVMLVRDENQSPEENHDIVVGNRVSRAAVRRSGLLSGIEHTDGQASLPSQLVPEEIRLWEATCIVDVEFPLDELITVLKVADALGDEKSACWTKKLGQRVAATDWQHPQQADAMLCALLRLPPHLLPSVIATGIDRKPLDDVLSTFPAALHQVAMSAAVQLPCADLTFKHYKHAAAALQLLTTASLSTPLRQVTVYAEQPAHASSTAPAALLARTASAITSLTCLEFLHHPVSPEWLRSFSACLPPGGLSSIQNFKLSADGPHAGCVEVISCLSRLPALVHLAVHFSLPQEAPPAEVSLSAYTRLVATPAVLPHLTSIAFQEGKHYSKEHVDSPSCASTFLPLISAPALTRLHFESRATFVSRSSLIETITRFAGLRSLDVEAALPASVGSSELQGRSADAPQMPPLEDVTAASTCPVSVVTLATAIARGASASLTALVLRMQDGYDDDRYCDQEFSGLALSSAWKRCFGALRMCGGLQALSLDCVGGVSPGSHARSLFRGGLVQGLSPLTRLTSLSFRGCICPLVQHGAQQGPQRLHGGSVGDVVAALPALRTLSFISSRYGHSRLFDDPQPVLDACVRLTGLESLEMRVREVTLQQVEGYLAKQTGLQSLELSTTAVRKWGMDDEFEAMTARFPGVVGLS